MELEKIIKKITHEEKTEDVKRILIFYNKQT